MTPKVEAIVPFISEQSSFNWIRDQWILRATLRSLLQLDDKFLSVTLVSHEIPNFVQGQNRIRLLKTEYSPPDKNSRDDKLEDSAKKYCAGVQDAFSRKCPWVFLFNADDFISRNLFRLANLNAYDAIVLTRGFSWQTGSRWLLRLSEFHRLCGSCNLIRCTEALFPSWLGGRHQKSLGDSDHNRVLDEMLQAGYRVQVLKNRLGVYRLGLHNNYWRPETGNVFSKIRALAKFILRAQPLTTKRESEFSIPFHEKLNKKFPQEL